MMIADQVLSAGETNEITLITRNFIVLNRMKELARTLKQ
jgi:hypothetical protein